jgi:hypothetical protein
VVAELHAIAGHEGTSLDGSAIDEGRTPAFEDLENKIGRLLSELNVVSRHPFVGQEHVYV